MTRLTRQKSRSESDDKKKQRKAKPAKDWFFTG